MRYIQIGILEWQSSDSGKWTNVVTQLDGIIVDKMPVYARRSYRNYETPEGSRLFGQYTDDSDKRLSSAELKTLGQKYTYRIKTWLLKVAAVTLISNSEDMNSVPEY
jgi:hypothetical protein